VGYREVVLYVQGTLRRDALADAIVSATARYAKRQETWLRHQLTGEVVTLDAVGEPEALAATIAARWRARED
jgi:tRNA A37 N6-isopentenylltransferase MiaA